jgi:hypothetical protein
MEEKLIMGGKLMDKANKQEQELRRAQRELEEKQRAEERLATELAEDEAATLNLEEAFGSLQEEAEQKTIKLKKLWTKYQEQEAEIRDLGEEFQRERTDMLDTIRDLTRQLKLKQVQPSCVPSIAVHCMRALGRGVCVPSASGGGGGGDGGGGHGGTPLCCRCLPFRSRAAASLQLLLQLLPRSVSLAMPATSPLSLHPLPLSP